MISELRVAGVTHLNNSTREMLVKKTSFVLFIVIFVICLRTILLVRLKPQKIVTDR